MSRFIARQWTEDDGSDNMVGHWGVFDVRTNQCIFGDTMPRDKREAEQCARAARLASYIIREEIKQCISLIGVDMS